MYLIRNWEPEMIDLMETHITSQSEWITIQIDDYVVRKMGFGIESNRGYAIIFRQQIKFWNASRRKGAKLISDGKLRREYYTSIIMLVFFYHSSSGSDCRFLDYLKETCNDNILRDVDC